MRQQVSFGLSTTMSYLCIHDVWNLKCLIVFEGHQTLAFCWVFPELASCMFKHSNIRNMNVVIKSNNIEVKLHETFSYLTFLVVCISTCLLDYFHRSKWDIAFILIMLRVFAAQGMRKHVRLVFQGELTSIEMSVYLLLLIEVALSKVEKD